MKTLAIAVCLACDDCHVRAFGGDIVEHADFTGVLRPSNSFADCWAKMTSANPLAKVSSILGGICRTIVQILIASDEGRQLIRREAGATTLAPVYPIDETSFSPMIDWYDSGEGDYLFEEVNVGENWQPLCHS